MISINIYRYNPEKDQFPYMQTYKFEQPKRDIMVLELLNQLKEKDPTISYRRSCREGVCGSDGMNINGKNGLACITPLSTVIKKNKILLRWFTPEIEMDLCGHATLAAAHCVINELKYNYDKIIFSCRSGKGKLCSSINYI